MKKITSIFSAMIQDMFSAPKYRADTTTWARGL